MKYIVIVWTLTTLFAACSKGGKAPVNKPPVDPPVIAKDKYINPVFTPILADPSVIKDESNNMFYAYGTQDDWGDGKGSHLVAIVKSSNLKDWQYIGDAFKTKPNWKSDGGIWAPEVVKANGKYFMYYSYSIWADPNPGIGLAVADAPQGPFTDKGKLFLSTDIGTPNAIDPFYIEDGGKKYLFYGSYSSAPDNGIWAVELSEDGMSVPDMTKKVRITSGDTEGAMLHKKDGYYYFFGSKNNCCDGAASIYQVRIGRSDNLLGPYLDKEGKPLTSWGNGSLFIERNARFAGPGHNARIITDDAGTDWFLYHAIDRGNPIVPSGANRRALMLDKIEWQNGWPLIRNGTPSTTEQQAPVFNP